LKFFKKELKENGTIHTPGFAAGIMKMARALEKLSIDGGYVSWSADGIPKLIPGQAASGVAVLFEAVSESGDYIMCARVASFDASQQPVAVAVPEGGTEKLFKVWKPWLLRSTPFDTLTRDGIEYAYTGVDIRTATPETGDPETQRITPSYSLRSTGHAGEVIHATPATTSGEFQDINTAGRCWAVGEEDAV
jgi:hypothetical protein